MNAAVSPGAIDARDNAFAFRRRDALVSDYRPGDSLFSSAETQLHSRGVLRSLSCRDDGELAHIAMRLLAQVARESGPRPLLGAIPFHAGEPSRLWVPAQAAFAHGHARHTGAVSDALPALVRATGVLSVPQADVFKHNVMRSLERIDCGDIDKVVMSRCLRIPVRIDISRLLSRLLARGNDGYTYAIDLPSGGGPRGCLIGSSPELLLARRGLRVVSNPLAGSIPRADSPEEDQHRARALLRSSKDRHEHALVVDAVLAGLAPYCRTLKTPAGPSLIATPTMWHLSTRIHGDLIDPTVSSLQLALALHPTPAVCGHPMEAARDLIRELEGYDRGLFTGLVGWCDASGDGEWAVTIRCALIEDDSATVYAGVGVVAGSQPAQELDETTAKLATMLGAMGLADLAQGLPENLA